MRRFNIITIILVTFVFGFVTDVSAQTAPALKTYTTTLPETVTRKTTGTAGFLHQSTTPIVRSWYSDDAASADGSGYQLYCSDRTNEVVGDDILTKGDKMEYGIAYLLMNAYPNVSLVNNVYAYDFNDVAGTNSDSGSTYEANVFITQYALWAYQGTVDASKLGNSQIGYTYDNTTEYSMYYDSKNDANILTESNLWKKANIDNLISKAKAANADSPYNAKLSINVDGEWSKIEGTNNSKSGLISVSTSSSAKISTYALSIENAPEGTKVYTEDGTDITGSISAIPASKKVYLVVNRDNVKEDVKFTVKANTTVTYQAAYQYVDKVNNPPHQPSVLVGPESKDVSAALEMTLSPDTALSVSSTIYFLGFIILISGAFIIYANVKPRKQTAE